MRTRSALYCVFNQDFNLIAFSEMIGDVEAYVYQNFDNKDYIIKRVSNKSKIKQILFTCSDTLYLDWLTEGIIVTRWEHEYYTRRLKELYSDVKIMTSQLLLYQNISNFDIDKKQYMNSTFEFIYNHIGTYEEFLTTLDDDMIRRRYIMKPSLLHSVIQLDDEFHDIIK